MKYDKEATARLAELMYWTVRRDCRSKNDYCLIGKFWRQRKPKTYNEIISGIATALNEGADPNPIPGKSLLAVLCTCPVQGSKTLIKCIETAVALGTDVQTPLVYTCKLPRSGQDDMEPNRYSRVLSPIHDMIFPCEYDESVRRTNAIFSKMPDIDIQSIFCPRPPVGTNGICIVEPLLCSHVSHCDLGFLMRHVENVKSETIKKTIVNVAIEICDGTHTYTHDEARAWALRNGMSPKNCSRLGKTPMEMLLNRADNPLMFTYPELPGELKSLLENMADATVETHDGLTLYGLACANGVANVLASGVLGVDLSTEFSHRDKLNRLLPAHIMGKIDPYTPSDLDICIVRTMLSEYAKCRNLDEHDRAEITEVLSHAMAQAATRSNANSAALVEMLLDAGADPCYALPGELPTWQRAVMDYGDHPISNMLIRKIPNPTDEMREWAAHYGIEYVPEGPQETEVER